MGGFVLDFSDAAMPDQSLSLSAQLESNQRLPSAELRCDQAIRSTTDCQTGVPISNDTGALSTATVSGRSSAVPEVCPKSNQAEPLAPQTQSIMYGPFWIYPQDFRLTQDYFNPGAEERIPQTSKCAFEQLHGPAKYQFKQIRFEEDCGNLSRLQIFLIREYGIIQRIPNVGEEELNDQSKGDLLVKSLAITQSMYLALRLIVRHQNHQPSSQLEIVVVAFAICSLITYLLLLYKPQDVQNSRIIQAQYYPTAQQMLAIARMSPQPLCQHSKRAQSYAPANLSIHIWSETWDIPSMFLVGSISASLIFGLLHCIAWSFMFPTPLEKLLWRISSLFTVLIPTIYTILSLTIALSTGTRGDVNKKGKKKRELAVPFDDTPRCLIIAGLALSFGAAYTLARLYVIVEIFRSLFFLPPEAFKTNAWLSALPSVG
ncbi:hypothetical protein V8E51_015543 [Hyaloscypha variabilis]